MNPDEFDKDEYDELIATVADLHFNQQMTQVEIAERFGTTRFKVAKMLQEARDEGVVEISVRFPNERNRALERELVAAYPLAAAYVVDTKYASFIDGLRQIGRMGATRVAELLRDGSAVGLAWGKSTQAVVEQLPQTARIHVDAVQLTGNFCSSRPTSESFELVRRVASLYLGDRYHLDAPLYVSDDDTRRALAAQPAIARTLERARRLDVVLTGVGGASSLPMDNRQFAPYVSEADRKAARECPGSILGYVLDKDGGVANIPINEKIMAVPFERVQAAPHRVAVSSGRNKAGVLRLVVCRGYVNELVTDTETAALMLEQA